MNVQEWRIYEEMPVRLSDLYTRFATHTLRLFEKPGMANIYYFPVRQDSKNPVTVSVRQDEN
jgi:hypothetical protein